MGSISTLSVSQQITALTFHGQSKFSDSYQQILTKSVANDTITLSALDDSRNSSQARLTAVQSLDTKLAALQAAVAAISSSLGDGALTANIQNTSLASITLSSGANAGTYQLEVDDLGAATQISSSASNTKVTNPNTQNIDTTTDFQLEVTDPDHNGGATQTTTISNPSGTLAGLVSAINSQPSLGVSATVVNVGSQSSPDYRLSLQSTSLGAVNIALSSANTSDLLGTATLGHNSSYSVNGNPISGTSDLIEISPGLSATLLAASPGNATTVTVNQSPTPAAAALQALAPAYNAVVDELATHHGANAGALSGDSILQTIQQALSSINNYNTSGSGLSNLGLNLDAVGHLTFDYSKFQTGMGKDYSKVSQFLGDKNSGFIKLATDTLNGLEDVSTGTVKTTEKTLTSSLKVLDSKIAQEISKANDLQNNLFAALSQSDAMVYSLDSQSNFLQQMFLQMSANLTGGVA